MQTWSHERLALALAREERERDIRDAAQARLLRSSARTSIRTSIGHSLIRFGHRLAADPPPRPARSR